MRKIIFFPITGDSSPYEICRPASVDTPRVLKTRGFSLKKNYEKKMLQLKNLMDI